MCWLSRAPPTARFTAGLRYPFIYDKERYCTGPKNNGMVSTRGAVWKASGRPMSEGCRLVMTCRNRLCLCISHMAPMTYSEAQKFAAEGGAYKSLRHNVARLVNSRKHAKLDRDKVLAIKAEVAAGRRRKDIANERGLCRSTVDQIMRGVRWSTTLAPNASVFNQAA